VDAQSVKNTDTAQHKGYDAGKKVSGIKRHIAVDTQGLPHAIHVSTADVTDRDGALAMFARSGQTLWSVVTVLAQAVAAAFLFAIETAMQAREICGLTAAMVVGKVAHLPATLTKIRRKRDVPLLTRAQPTCDADCAGGRRPAVRADITVAGCIVPEGQGAVLD
jgi:hypothetical protein